MSDAVIEKLVREVVGLRRRVGALETLEAPAHPACRVYHNANQSIQHDTRTPLAFNSVRYDSGGLYDPDANSRLTCQVAGLYLITGHVMFGQHADGCRQVYILAVRAGGGQAHIAIVGTPALQGAPTPLSVATAWYMEPGDYVRLQVRQNSGGALPVVTGEAYSPEFTMTRIG